MAFCLSNIPLTYSKMDLLLALKDEQNCNIHFSAKIFLISHIFWCHYLRVLEETQFSDSKSRLIEEKIKHKTNTKSWGTKTWMSSQTVVTYEAANELLLLPSGHSYWLIRPTFFFTVQLVICGNWTSMSAIWNALKILVSFGWKSHAHHCKTL